MLLCQDPLSVQEMPVSVKAKHKSIQQAFTAGLLAVFFRRHKNQALVHSCNKGPVR